MSQQSVKGVVRVAAFDPHGVAVLVASAKPLAVVWILLMRLQDFLNARHKVLLVTQFLI